MHKIKELKNGIKVVYEKNSYIRSATVGVWVNVGSINETKEESGITHFIEHMLFKGTEKRTAKDIAEEMDAIGGQINAFTSREVTCYYAKTLDEDIKTSLSILSDMLYNSKFDQDEMDKECNVILEEMSMCEDDLEDVTNDLMLNKIYKDNTYGNPIIGYKDTITKFTTQMCKDYVKKWYTPKNIVISVVGNIKEDELLNMLQFYFGEKKIIDTNLNEVDTPIFNKVFSTKDKEAEQLHIALSFESLGIKDENMYNIAVFNTIFGGGMSSILFQSVREDYGLAYSVYSQNSTYKNHGLYNIFVASNPQNKSQVIELIEKEIKNIDKISEKSFNQAKQQIKSSYLLSLESTTSRMNSIGKSLLVRDRVLTPDDIIKKIDNVDFDKTIKLMVELLNLNNYSTTLVGNIKDMK